MPLARLDVRDFRNLARLEIEFHPEFNFIHGRNAQGKTNLLEAIFALATLKSFRTADKAELVARGGDSALVCGKLLDGELQWDIELTLTASERRLLVNGKRPRTRREYFGLMPLIIFEPRHIYLFRDPPSVRRQFLNRALFLEDSDMLEILAAYDRALAQKNRLLKENPDPAQISVFNEKLAELGGELMFRRRRWFNNAEAIVASEYRSASGSREELRLAYLPSQGLLADTPGFADASLTAADWRSALAEQLSGRENDELKRREAFIGPHRDDWTAFLDGRGLGELGSQGENRSAVIALKLAQLKLFTMSFGKTPLFLLDDVASELDETRCRHLFSYLRDARVQAFLTTTENRLTHEEFQGRSRSFLIEQGGVSVIA